MGQKTSQFTDEELNDYQVILKHNIFYSVTSIHKFKLSTCLFFILSFYIRK